MYICAYSKPLYIYLYINNTFDFSVRCLPQGPSPPPSPFISKSFQSPPSFSLPSSQVLRCCIRIGSLHLFMYWVFFNLFLLVLLPRPLLPLPTLLLLLLLQLAVSVPALKAGAFTGAADVEGLRRNDALSSS